MTVECYNCGRDLSIFNQLKVGRTEECPSCQKELHCCRMCHHYDPTKYNECREPISERITDKQKSNFCDYFKFTQQTLKSHSKEDLLSAASSLFKK